MKKTIITVGIIALFPLISSAYFDQNLKYGQTGPAVTELQDLLVEGGYLHVNPTGFFGLLTLQAVKDFQTANNVPSTGYFGVLSRGVANTMTIKATASSTDAEIEETGTTTPVVTPSPVETPAPIVQGAGQVELSISPLVCTTNNVQVGKGNLVYEFKINTDWTKVKSVLIAQDSSHNGSFGDRQFVLQKGQDAQPLILQPHNFRQGNDVVGVAYKLYAYDTENSIGNLLGSTEGTITEPSCN